MKATTPLPPSCKLLSAMECTPVTEPSDCSHFFSNSQCRKKVKQSPYRILPVDTHCYLNFCHLYFCICVFVYVTFILSRCRMPEAITNQSLVHCHLVVDLPGNHIYN